MGFNTLRKPKNRPAERRRKQKGDLQEERLCRKSNLWIGTRPRHDPSAEYRPYKKGQECRQRTCDGQAGDVRCCELKKHDISRHVSSEHVPERQKTDSVHQAGDRRHSE